MSMTLGEALMANDGDQLNMANQSLTEEGYKKARAELEKNHENIKPESLETGELDGALKTAFLSALDIAIDDILGSAWAGWSELRDYADPKTAGVNFVALSNHTIESVYQPSVDIVLGGQKLHSFEFDVSAKLDVESANLEVEHGKIQAIRLGKLKLSGSVKLGDHSFFEKEVAEEVALPGMLSGVIRLSRPIPIQ